MLGGGGRLGGREVDGKKLMVPHERKVGDGVLRIVSMGFLVEDEESALMWRGLMLNRGVPHFLQDVVWGDDLDYLFVDMTPGTGHRKSVVWGKSVSVRVDLGGRRCIKSKN